FSGAIFLTAIFRRQWTDHERLSYPLASLQSELLASPAEGRYFNALWSNPVLWAGIAMPFFVYLFGGMHSIWHSVPGISLDYDQADKFTEIPWCYIPDWITRNRLYFSAVGIAFFLPSE